MRLEDLIKLVLQLDSRTGNLEDRVTDIEKGMSTKGPRRKKDKSPTINLDNLECMSTTELVEIARLLGHSGASRMIPREDLIDLILGEPYTLYDPLEGIRVRIDSFVAARKPSVSTMKCSLHCRQCPHDDVVVCYYVNHDVVDDHPEIS